MRCTCVVVPCACLFLSGCLFRCQVAGDASRPLITRSTLKRGNVQFNAECIHCTALLCTQNAWTSVACSWLQLFVRVDVCCSNFIIQIYVSLFLLKENKNIKFCTLVIVASYLVYRIMTNSRLYYRSFALLLVENCHYSLCQFFSEAGR